MLYRVWFGTLNGVKDYLNDSNSCYGQFGMFEDNEKECAIPIVMGFDDHFNLEDIDSITAQFKDEKDFLSWLGKSNLRSYPECHVLITHRYNGVREDSVIYDNSLLVSCAQEVQKKKAQGLDTSSIWLTPSSELVEFSKRVASYIKNPETRGDFLKLDVYPLLSMAIRKYASDCDLNRESYTSKCFGDIFNGCRRYSSLRKFIVLEEKYKIQQKQIKEQRASEKAQKRKMLEDIALEEKLRHEAIDHTLIDLVYNTRDSDGEIDWDLVWNRYSADDIYRPSNYDDLKRIGFFGTDVEADGYLVGSDRGRNGVKIKNDKRT